MMNCIFKYFSLLLLVTVLNLSFVQSASFVKVEEGVQFGTGIAPNEFRHDFFSPFLSKKKGIFVSVGSFRTLNESAVGDFSKTILMDYDSKVSAFNLVNLELIAKNNNRRRYIAELVTGTNPTIWKKYYAGAGSDHEFINAIKKYVESSAYKFETANFKKTLSKELFDQLDDLVKSGAWTNSMKEMFSPKNQWGYSALESYFQNETWNQTLFGSDEIYNIIRKNNLNGNIHVINGSISSAKTAKYLSNYANEVHDKISVLDISNADSHLAKGATGKEQLKQLSNFIEELPLSDDAILLSTSKDAEVLSGYKSMINTADIKNADHWRYFVHTPKQYKQTLQQTLQKLKDSESATIALEKTLNSRDVKDEVLKVFQLQLDSKIRVKNPKAIIIAGPMGVGKTTIVEELMSNKILNEDEWMVIDADKITKNFSVYQRSLNKIAVADALHNEASELANVLAGEACRGNRNVIVYSSLGNSKSLAKTLEVLQDAKGIYLVNVEAPLEEILKRNEMRKLQGGHYVSPEKIKNAFEKAKSTISEIKDQVSSVITIDNTKISTITKVENIGGHTAKVSWPINKFNDAIYNLYDESCMVHVFLKELLQN